MPRSSFHSRFSPLSRSPPQFPAPLGLSSPRDRTSRRPGRSTPNAPGTGRARPTRRSSRDRGSRPRGKRQLKSEPPPIFRLHISGVIPPLRLILRMVEVIPRKLVLVSGQRRLKISIALPREEQHERENSRPTPHARPQADSVSSPRAPDKTPPAPSPHTPPSTLPAAPPPANGNESSIRMTAC